METLDLNQKLMIFPENQEEFNFDTLIKNNNYMTISGLRVKIDRIIKDITGTTTLAVSGTMVVRGVKIRAVWDMFGNIMEAKKVFSLFAPKQVDVAGLFSGYEDALFKLVNVIPVGQEKDNN